MLALRLLVAFLIAVSLPLQGIAASTCRCAMDQAHRQAQPGAQASVQASAAAAVHLPAASKIQLQHGSGPGCSHACCQATAPTLLLAFADRGAGFGERFADLQVPFESWAELVPHKPPRS